MSIEFNYGWLNDYTGSRFAPFTIANCVLIDTSSGTTETLVDYLEYFTQRVNLDINYVKNNAIDHEKKLRALLLKNPTYTNDKTGEEEKLPPLGVQYAGKLTIVDEQGGISNRDGISIGSLSAPVFFESGLPKQCYRNITTTQSTNFNDILQPNQNLPTHSVDFKLIGQTDGGSRMALDININGVAQDAQHANEAYKAVAAQFAGTSILSTKSNSLTYNIEFGRKYKDGNGTIDYENYAGDIIGTANTMSDNFAKDNGTLPAELNLKEILSSEVASESYGPRGDTPGFVQVPFIKVDRKGRIISIQNKSQSIALTLNSMSEINNVKKAYLIGTTADAGGNKYIHTQGQGGDDNKSIYIEWTNINEPVLMGAAWNDYAEYRSQVEPIKPGYCVKSNDNGKVEKIKERMSICDGIVSDTFGFSIGKTDNYQTPIAVAGRVLAYCEGSRKDYHAGDVVCASENGKVCKMTREEIRDYPDRIVGTVSEIPSYLEWNHQVIDGRIWIKVR